MLGQNWKTVAVIGEWRTYCGNCECTVDDQKWLDQLVECPECHWLCVYPQSTAPTTTARIDNQYLWSREGSFDEWME